MTITYPTITYDDYWKQIVVGYGKYKFGQGLIFWKRLFGFPKVSRKLLKKRYTQHDNEVR